MLLMSGYYFTHLAFKRKKRGEVFLAHGPASPLLYGAIPEVSHRLSISHTHTHRDSVCYLSTVNWSIQGLVQPDWG